MVRSDSPPVPVVDIGAYLTHDRHAAPSVIDAFGNACGETGFAIITGHGVDRGLVEQMQRVALTFFAQSLDEKMKCSAPEGTNRFKGYVPVDRMATGRASLIEIFQAKPFESAADAAAAGVPADRLDEYSGNVWPDGIAGFRSTWAQYYEAMARLVLPLFEMIASFFGAPADYFESLNDRHVSDLAINFYPPQLQPPEAAQLRAQPHTDFGTLTLLAQDRAGGLQIEDASGRWVDVPVVPDTFVVNLGELMTPWTNGRWRATLHRVVNPPRAAAGEHRMSIAFFNKPNYEAVVECIPGCEGDGRRYPPIVAGEWFDARRRTEAKASAMDDTLGAGGR